ncbi:hypothetical protein V1478_007079 [Vespula squamosa]|uniref:Uncharacterized protein n=1 Tax=Vespula squamosa TaxID=30214 RepID=A0ABD2B291_VESSQ
MKLIYIQGNSKTWWTPNLERHLFEAQQRLEWYCSFGSAMLKMRHGMFELCMRKIFFEVLMRQILFEVHMRKLFLEYIRAAALARTISSCSSSFGL